MKPCVWLVTLVVSAAGAQEVELSPYVPVGDAYPVSGELDAAFAGVHLKKQVVILPELAGLAPLRLGPVSPGAGVDAAAPLTVKPGVAESPALALDTRTALAWLRLARGDTSPEVLGRLRPLPDKTILDRLASASRWGTTPLERDGMVHLLAERGALVPTQAKELPRPVALALGEYLARRSDGRCVAVLEGLLATHDPADHPLPELVSLGEYYRRTGRPKQAAETLERAPRYTASKPVAASLLVDAARLYAQAGDLANADRVYEQVASFGYGWATGMAMYDRATGLIRERKFVEARTLLDQPVSGQYADQSAVAIEFARAQAYAAEGDLEAAKRCYESVVAKAEALGHLLPGEGLEGAVAAARAALRDDGSKP